MGKTSFQQTSFLGGEWSDHAQGRMDSDKYKIALNKSTNYYPVETGCLVRRMGTHFLGTTKGGAPGRVMGVDFSITDPYQLEFTDGWMRVFTETGLVLGTSATISTISSATPAEITASASLPGDWATGDTVIFVYTGDQFVTVASRLRNWQFVITKTASNKFTIVDAVSGVAIDGTNLGGASNAGGKAYKVFELATSYTGSKWASLRKVQDETKLILLHPTVKPYVVTKPAGSSFAINAASFTDGPYLDVNTTATTFTPSATTGSITVTASATTGINNDTGFQSTDVGRMIRLFSQPNTWLSASDYVQGDSVTWEGNYYSATRSVKHGPSSPAENVSSWAPVNDVAFWSWGTITAVTNTTHVTVSISGHDLVNTNATTTWRLGLYGDTLGYPTCGAYHEDRLWLSGVLPNRLDGSKVGDYFNFAPSGDDGTVADDNACAVIFKAVDANDIFWLLSEDDGLWGGTQAGEWRVRASTLDDPITPTSIQVRRITTFGSFNADAICAPSTILFIQRAQRKVLELMADQNETSHYAPNLSLTAEHMMLGNAVELAMYQEPSHLLFVRMEDGTLKIVHYMRAPDKYFAAWTPVSLGCDRTVESISVGPADDGNSEKLFMVTNDATNVRHVNVTGDVFNADTPVWAAEFMDDAVRPSGAQILSVSDGDAINGIRLFGLYPLIGMTASVVIGGLDLGDFSVTTDTLDIPFTDDFSTTFLQELNNAADYGNYNLKIAAEA